MRRWFIIFAILPIWGLAQSLFTTGFWQALVSGGSGPGAFSIFGVQGSSDTVIDAWLVNGTDAKISFGYASSAASYDVQIKDTANTLMCQSLNVATPAATEWLPTSLGANYPSSGRVNHSAVWTGTEMIIWGGYDGSAVYNSGHKYNPTTDSWTLTSTGANVPTARRNHAAVWTGSEMIIWGGWDNASTHYNTGAKYNPSANTWTTTTTTSAPTGRREATATWTGTEMIIWGGWNGTTHVNTGARYNPTGNSWSAVSTTSAPTARRNHSDVWTGTEMIIWGGWNGTTYVNTGAKYNPTTNTWDATSTTSAPAIRRNHTAVWTGTEMIIWGGWNGTTALNTGGKYKPSQNSWTSTSTGANVPEIRYGHTSVWTGYEMIVWGGYDSVNHYNTGSKYNPSTDSWTVLPAGANLPLDRYQHTTVWTGTEMIIWGGLKGVTFYNDGGRFYPHVNASLSSCNLAQATSYKVYVTAKTASNDQTTASNNAFTFTVDNVAPTTNSILGIQGASDSNNDAWLSGGLVPMVMWNLFTGASSYEVLIKNSTGATTTCGAQNSTNNYYNFTGCNLTNGSTYTAYLTGKSPSGYNTTAASNTGFSFTVDNNTPGAFSITGITGGSDTFPNNVLTVLTDPTVNFGTSTNAYRYDVTVKDSSGTTTLCSSLDQATTSVALSSCGLTEGPTYKAYVTAKSISGAQTTNATNNGYSFTINTSPLSPGNFTISGATASPGDTTADNWLTSGTTVTANWGAASGATSYDVTIRDNGDTADVCATQNTASTSYTFSGCPLTSGTSYKIKVSAKNSTATPTAAINNGYVFQVVTSAPTSFTITGATGGTDADADGFLMNGTTVTANWGAASGATSYDVTIRDNGDTADVCTTQNTASTSYTFTGCALSANTTYTIKVIAKSGSTSITAANAPYPFYLPNTLSFCPTGSSTAKALVVYDSGGSGTNYSSSESCNFTFSPPATASQITLNFGLFDSKDTADILTVYDGTSTAGTNLGAHSNTSTAPVDKTASTGNMYLTWVSGSGGGTSTAAGYQLNFKSFYSPPSSFSITGITGGTDSTADTNLTDNASGVTVAWGASTGATSYDVTIRSSANTTDVCTTQNTASTSYNFASCTLTAGVSYAAVVYAKDSNGQAIQASNSPYIFTYDTRPVPFTITGITGGTDTQVDNFLDNNQTTPTVNWAASSGQTSYDVTIYENDGITVRCPTTNVAFGSTSYSFASCTLLTNVTYKAEVIAKNANGNRAATNSLFRFNTGTAWSPTSLTSVPTGRMQHTAVWTGSEMIVWGGQSSTTILNTGGKYNPTTNAWSATSTGANVPTARQNHAALWTGTEMIIWGGLNISGSDENTGSKYNPSANTWSAMSTGSNVPSARQYPASVWTGTEMIIWGGNTTAGAYLSDGGKYNPTTNTWSSSNLNLISGYVGINFLYNNTGAAVWTGAEMIIWGNDRRGGKYNPTTDSWSLTSTTNAPSARSGYTAVWTGTEMIIWGGVDTTGGKYNPSTDTWTATSTTSAPIARQLHTAIWTGTEMIIWGGYDGGTNFYNTGGKYNPSTDSWTTTSTGTNVPTARNCSGAVWTGTEMIVWGGRNVGSYYNTGAKYNPSTDTWTTTSTGTNVPTGRTCPGAVWTGTEMIVWGGTYSLGRYNTGGKYNPSSNSWTTVSTGSNVPSVRDGFSTVWTGTEMIIWGGNDDGDTATAFNTGSKYNPSTDTWTAMTVGSSAPAPRYGQLTVWTGTEMIVQGGTLSYNNYNDGGRYNPTTNTWVPISTGTVSGSYNPTPRTNMSSVWTGTEMIVWGGNIAGAVSNTGGKYNPTTDSWTPTSTGTNTPSVRSNHTAIWTGTEMIVWGGWNGTTYVNTGGKYNPTSDTWTPTSVGTNVPAIRGNHTSIWTGTEMIVWGGYNGPTNTGGKYYPSTDTWYPTSTGTNLPTARVYHTGIWTGTEMIIWGGQNGSSFYNTGGLYSP